VTSSGSRRGRWAAIGLTSAAVLAAGGFVGWQALERPAVAEVSPAPGGAVASTAPALQVRLQNADRLRDLRVLVDGEDVTDAARGAADRLVIPTSGLSQGAHTAEVSFGTDNLFGRTVRTAWDFEVDTAPPRLKVASPTGDGLSRRRTVRFAGTAEPGATVAVAWRGGSRTGTARADGAFAVAARLPEGLVATTVSARDRAGNTTASQREVVVDTVAPRLVVSQPASGTVLTETDTPRVYGTVRRDDPRLLVFGATVNGRVATRIPGAAGVAGTAGEGVQEVSATTVPLQLDGRRFAFAVGQLPQGLNTVRVWVRDRAGNVSGRTVRLMVDSSEEFGATDMRQGARGEDARTLNRRLKDAGLLRGAVTATYGPRTRAAVIRYQGRHKLRKTGVVDARTREAMVGRIVVDLSDFTLRLIRDGRVVMRYRVATGTPSHPTPVGEFRVVNKQVDPTWIPPDSPWAEGLGPIPPGPGNPLGTRWIGTSAPAVGIHGTYADSSIGTRASHGCIRMHIPEVEKLYDQVSVGMPVILKP
jgi:lipoprotein-anchoring transpeptidase ErfK/SrfK